MAAHSVGKSVGCLVAWMEVQSAERLGMKTAESWAAWKVLTLAAQMGPSTAETTADKWDETMAGYLVARLETMWAGTREPWWVMCSAGRTEEKRVANWAASLEC